MRERDQKQHKSWELCILWANIIFKLIFGGPPCFQRWEPLLYITQTVEAKKTWKSVTKKEKCKGGRAWRSSRIIWIILFLYWLHNYWWLGNLINKNKIFIFNYILFDQTFVLYQICTFEKKKFAFIFLTLIYVLYKHLFSINITISL